MTDVRDPGPEVVDKILGELEECKWSPTDVARQARRLRAHIEALRTKVDRLIPRYAQPCADHEYIEPSCSACGVMVKVDPDGL
jgi:hypothetical protein